MHRDYEPLLHERSILRDVRRSRIPILVAETRHGSRLQIPQTISPAFAIRTAGTTFRAQGSGSPSFHGRAFRDVSGRARGANASGTAGSPPIRSQSDDGTS